MPAAPTVSPRQCKGCSSGAPVKQAVGAPPELLSYRASAGAAQ
jgi:hypothetical protein